MLVLGMHAKQTSISSGPIHPSRTLHPEQAHWKPYVLRALKKCDPPGMTHKGRDVWHPRLLQLSPANVVRAHAFTVVHIVTRLGFHAYVPSCDIPRESLSATGDVARQIWPCQGCRSQSQSPACVGLARGRKKGETPVQTMKKTFQLRQIYQMMLWRTKRLLFCVFCPVFDFVKSFFDGHHYYHRRRPAGRTDAKKFQTPKRESSARQTRKT